MKNVLKALSQVYTSAMKVRNGLYEKDVLKTIHVDVPVVSVGNLTMGGTGKTPIVDWLLNRWVQAGKNVAVVSRAYKAKAQEPCKVDLDKQNPAQFYGDEVVMLARRHPQVDFYSGQVKSDIAPYACAQKKYDLILVDDGFQHLRLHRDLDIVLLDATENIENYQVVPAGRAREPWTALGRAGLVFVTKANQAGDSDVQSLRTLIPMELPVVEFGFQLKSLTNIAGQSLDISQDRVFLMTGIAKPGLFEKMVGDMGIQVVETRIFEDHVNYSWDLIEQIIQEALLKNLKVLTTSKDFVKIQELLASKDSKNLELFYVADLEVACLRGEGKLDEVFHQILPN